MAARGKAPRATQRREAGPPAVPGTQVPAKGKEAFVERGASGTAIHGGFIVTIERNPKAVGAQRYVEAANILANVSIVAASVRYFLNLLAKAKWKANPASDKPEAKAMAEFAESVLADMHSGWSRIVRRSGMYRFHGFSTQEWTAKRRTDGKVGILDIEARPQRTIEQWTHDGKGTVTGILQRSPQDSRLLPIPRWKLLYMVDDVFSDSPEGIGWFRHLLEPSERLAQYLKLEGVGFERDLSGTPVGRAPITAINNAVAAGKMTKKEGEAAIAVIEKFVRMEVKLENTGLVFDSQHFEDVGADGRKTTGVPQWGIELLTGKAESIEALGVAVERLERQMARIMGTEAMLLGSGGGANRSLAEDKSESLSLSVNSTLRDMSGFATTDLIDALWILNGLDQELKPEYTCEDVAFRDVEQITAALRDMATAGAILAPDDPAIDDVRDLLGVSRQPEMNEERVAEIGAMQTALQPIPPVDPAAEEYLAEGDEFGKSAERTLYVHRPLLNAHEVIQWAKDQGFRCCLPPDQMHVTLCYSKTPLVWPAPLREGLTVRSKTRRDRRSIEQFGDATVLRFDDRMLSKRAEELREAGAASDHPEFSAHVTITYDPGNLVPEMVEPYAGRLEFGPEVFSEVDGSWESALVEKKRAGAKAA